MANGMIRTSGIVWEELEREALLVNPETGASWLLNATATLIWKQFSDATELKALSRAIAKHSGQRLRVIESEIHAFCAALTQAGLLQPTTAASSTGSYDSAAYFVGEYSSPIISGCSLGAGPRRRPNPRGNSGPG